MPWESIIAVYRRSRGYELSIHSQGRRQCSCVEFVVESLLSETLSRNLCDLIQSWRRQERTFPQLSVAPVLQGMLSQLLVRKLRVMDLNSVKLKLHVQAVSQPGRYLNALFSH